MKAHDLEAAFASLPLSWHAVLPGWTAAKRFAVSACIERVSGEREIAPDDPLRALRLVAPHGVKVVVIGQDPYPTAGHADGLAFSAAKGRPQSLRRLFEVLAADRADFVPPESGRLDDWARRGVLLLNPVLTVEIGRSGSHEACGWQALTREIAQVLARRHDPPVFMLWGGRAQAFFAASLADGPGCRTLSSRHPSYDLKREFMAGGSHFAATADLVDWWAIGRPCVL